MVVVVEGGCVCLFFTYTAGSMDMDGSEGEGRGGGGGEWKVVSGGVSGGWVFFFYHVYSQEVCVGMGWW